MTIGILGGGQLGRMLALAGYPLGLRFRCFEASTEAPAGRCADLVVGSFQDEAALADFAASVDLVTYEFENVPLPAAEFVAARKLLHPGPAALAVSQERLKEKSFFQTCGLALPQFRPCETKAELEAAVAELGLPTVLKTRRFGYDGKGQWLLKNAGDVEAAYAKFGGVPLILEEFVPFDREVSLVAARGRAGEVAFYPLVENLHREGMLRETFAPAPNLTDALQRQAEGYAQAVMAKLNYVGVLAIEFFQVGDGLLVNEMAPRVHNSGHWTIEGAATSQFENHLRAILGWPLGPTMMTGTVAMINLIGDLPPLPDLLRIPGCHPHYYDKEVRPGRKVGHVTLVCPDEATRQQRLEQLRLLAPNQ